jgi:hypothetical protein
VAITLISAEEQALFMAIDNAVRRPIMTKRLEGFAYIFPEDEFTSAAAAATRKGGRRPSATKSFRAPSASEEKRENPFTKSGRLKKKFESRELEDEPRRNSRKRIEKRLRNKKLPHQKG